MELNVLFHSISLGQSRQDCVIIIIVKIIFNFLYSQYLHHVGRIVRVSAGFPVPSEVQGPLQLLVPPVFSGDEVQGAVVPPALTHRGVMLLQVPDHVLGAEQQVLVTQLASEMCG